MRVNHLGMSVADLERSIAFYSGLLGFEVVFRSTVHDRDDIEAVVGMSDVHADIAFLDAGDTRLELWHYRTPAGHPLSAAQVPADLGLRHLALEVDDVAAAHRLLTEAGYPATTVPLDLGPHVTFYVRGPDGEILEILEDKGSDAATMRALQQSREP